MSNPSEPQGPPHQGGYYPPPPPRGSAGPILIGLSIAVAMLLAGGIAVVMTVGSGSGTTTVAEPTTQRAEVAPSDTQVPTDSATPTPSPALTDLFPDTDPACFKPQMGNTLAWVEDEFKRGAWDQNGSTTPDRIEVMVSVLVLLELEKEAGFGLMSAVAKARITLNMYLQIPEGHEARRVLASRFREEMANVARVCGMDAALSFADGSP